MNYEEHQNELEEYAKSSLKRSEHLAMPEGHRGKFAMTLIILLSQSIFRGLSMIADAIREGKKP